MLCEENRKAAKWLTVVYPRFPRRGGGGANPDFGVKTYYLVSFCRILHANERNWTESVQGLPMVNLVNIKQFNQNMKIPDVHSNDKCTKNNWDLKHGA